MSRSGERLQLKRIEIIDNLKGLEYIPGMAQQLPVSEVIKQLGGRLAVASKFKVGETAVMNWEAWGRFPHRLHLDVYLACREANIDYDPREAAA